MAAAAAPRSSPYGRLLRSPGVGRQAVGGLLAQITQGATGIGIILTVRQHGGSLALGGAVSGGVWVAAGVARPFQGRVIDRRGSTTAMAVCGAVHALGLTGIVLVSGLHGARWPLVVFAVLAGLALPPVSTSMRIQLGALADGDRTAAYSLVYLTQELAVLIGPLILALAVALASAAAGLVVVAGATALGALIFVSAVHGDGVGVLEPAVAPVARVLGIRSLRQLLAVAVLIGSMLGALQVAASALATARGAPALAGVLIACVSVGGIAGAVVYGSRPWRSGPLPRVRILLVAMTIAMAPLVAVDSVVLAGALLLLAGLAFNPALTTFSLLLDQAVPAPAAAEAFGWLSTSLAAGTGAGSVLAASLAHSRHGFHSAFAVACASVALAALLSVRRRA